MDCWEDVEYCRAVAAATDVMELTRRLVFHESAMVRLSLARNPRIPGDVLVLLLRDTSAMVRDAASVNPAVETFMYIALDGDPELLPPSLVREAFLILCGFKG